MTPDEDTESPEPPRPKPAAHSSGTTVICTVCPECGSADYKKRKPDRMVAFIADRVCRACGTRYAPPTPVWAGVVFLLVGMFLAGFGAISVLLKLASGNPLGIPAMVCEGFLAIVGLAAIIQGLRAIFTPGRA